MNPTWFVRLAHLAALAADALLGTPKIPGAAAIAAPSPSDPPGRRAGPASP